MIGIKGKLEHELNGLVIGGGAEERGGNTERIIDMKGVFKSYMEP